MTAIPRRALTFALLVAAAPGAAPAPTRVELALTWASGQYVAPVVCPLDSGPERVVRKVRIRPPRTQGHRPMYVVEVHPLRVGDQTCTDGLGRPEPDVDGALRIAMTAHTRPDIAEQDFAQALRRDGGFRFDVKAGRLRVRDAAGERQVEFAGGAAELRRIVPGSDADRLLRGLGDAPKRTLTLEAPGGERLEFRLLLLGPP